MFAIRNSYRARKSGWITTSTSVAELSVTANALARTLTFRWRTSEDDERDAEAAEADQLCDEGKPVVSIGWGDDDRTIEYEVAQSLRARTEIAVVRPQPDVPGSVGWIKTKSRAFVDDALGEYCGAKTTQWETTTAIGSERGLRHSKLQGRARFFQTEAW